jgi:hypothetical protein
MHAVFIYFVNCSSVLTPGSSSTVHIYKQYTEKNKKKEYTEQNIKMKGYCRVHPRPGHEDPEGE